MGSGANVRGRVVKRIVLILCFVCAGLLSGQLRSASFLPFDDGLERMASDAAEHYALPITPPLDQGDSDLCWVYATLSMLETNYLSGHPGSHIDLSRAALQVGSIADRFTRRIRGEPGKLEDGGLAVEALALIRQYGLVARGDFHDIVDSEPIFSSIEEKIAAAADPAEKGKVVFEGLKSSLGELPGVTHLDGEALRPGELAKAVLGRYDWSEFDLARDGAEGPGPSHDPDGRPDTRVMYVKLDRLIDLIHRSLANGRSVVAGTADHSLLIYGADYDRDGKPLSYLIKDSLAPFLYRKSAEELHGQLNDVTVALQGTPPLLSEQARLGTDSAATLRR